MTFPLGKQALALASPVRGHPAEAGGMEGRDWQKTHGEACIATAESPCVWRPTHVTPGVRGHATLAACSWNCFVWTWCPVDC